MNKVIGHNVKCGYIDTIGTRKVFNTFAYARQASISIKRDIKEISSPNTGDSKCYIPSRKSWSMSCGCLLSDDEDIVWDFFNDGTKITVSFKVEDGKSFKGEAYIKSLKATGNIHDMATFDIDLQGTGPLTYE